MKKLSDNIFVFLILELEISLWLLIPTWLLKFEFVIEQKWHKKIVSWQLIVISTLNVVKRGGWCDVMGYYNRLLLLK